ncbi:YchJ family protein [Magnetospirillum aberrantis SpK]|uniref:YchJ family protein n=1 Tax=Magnetospirillum aberrantis SpK TaxID=908842 RepID=A0A7C9QUI3_9PROT|nr:YchJ family protein [Magnetospirillum aberrantis]NFV80399.1 YchJ family protein [Magnetospirillum aberrantis SpK]
MSLCPCSSGRSLVECCQPVIDGVPAPSAESLMRARYTAFVSGRMDFLDRTLAPEKRDDVDHAEVEASAREAQGLGLDVRASQQDGDTATVEYVARFRLHGQQVAHHELARFRREGGEWLYVDGDVNPKAAPRVAAKVGRNDPCPCGSGQKYKKCCGA